MLSRDRKSLTSEQIRAARALLNWSAAELASKANVGVATIRRAEAGGNHDLSEASEKAIRHALEEGVRFIDQNGEGPGVRLRKHRRYEHSLGYDKTFQLSDGSLVCAHLQWSPQNGAPILCVSAVDEEGRYISRAETTILARAEIPEINAIHQMPQSGRAYYDALLPLLDRFGFNLSPEDRSRVLAAMVREASGS